jgi:hypothetical protein
VVGWAVCVDDVHSPRPSHNYLAWMWDDAATQEKACSGLLTTSAASIATSHARGSFTITHGVYSLLERTATGLATASIASSTESQTGRFFSMSCCDARQQDAAAWASYSHGPAGAFRETSPALRWCSPGPHMKFGHQIFPGCPRYQKSPEGPHSSDGMNNNKV